MGWTYLSHYLDAQTPSYGDRSPVELSTASCMAHGDSSNSLTLKINNHVGTHIDLPRHFDDAGRQLHDYPAATWVIDRVQLVDAPLDAGELLRVTHLEGQVRPNTEFLLVRTGFESRRGQAEYWRDNPGVHEEVGHWLRSQTRVNALGLDIISLTSFRHRDMGKLAHRAFLRPENSGRPILIVEDMHLAHLQGQVRRAVVAPWLIHGADGAPVTVLAETDI